ncbi:hypothetical protein EYF80_021700 [Liparis tanakae]|uniref:Uncharacterized protein n=1 Tax=Liparis tanakae TaxID=230148 RepID=A0A4Z2HRW2_9TELE|nr:hypothetical protein EYF80_021700 [Liparis tanakae]
MAQHGSPGEHPRLLPGNLWESETTFFSLFNNHIPEASRARNTAVIRGRRRRGHRSRAESHVDFPEPHKMVEFGPDAQMLRDRPEAEKQWLLEKEEEEEEEKGEVEGE